MRIIKFVILFLLLSLFSSLAHSTGRFGINAYQAGQVICNANNQFKSTFVFNSNRKSWIEKTADGQRFQWQQAMRDEWSIYLDDRSRGYVMQIDLHTTKVTYGKGGNRQQYLLCNIVSASTAQPVPPPKPKNLGQHCANENQRCNFNGIAVVKYGANNQWTSRQHRGPVNCDNRTFGDPAPGIAKACYFTMVNQSPQNNLGQFCANENQRCSFNGIAVVKYGANNQWTSRKTKGPVNCNNRMFGDPAPGIAKACYFTMVNQPPQNNLGQFCANENQRCNFRGIAVVKYGANNQWTSRQIKGPVNCDNRTFGDPAPGIAKACYFTMVNQPPQNNLGQFCANENQVCNFSGNAIVNYGANNRWITRQMSGPVNCNNRTFGDPNRGAKKACYYRALADNNSRPQPRPNPIPNPRPVPVDDGSQYDINEKTIAGMSQNKANQLVKWVIAESMRQEQPMCWKKSKPNTAGKPLSSCPSGKRKEGLLCYKKCRKGYRSDGAMLCYKKCPKGTKTSPGFCHYKLGSIGGCPSPLKGLKPACMNTNSYSRGVGTPMVCAKGQVQKGALCYPKCPGGYAHGGPVCWQQCSGAHPVDCGAGCAQSTGKCVSEVANMVLATGELVANIAGLALTGGTANAGIKTAKTAARTGQKVAAKIALKKALQSARGAVRDKLTSRLGSRVFAYVGKKSGRRAGDKLVRDYAKMVLEKAAQKILISQVSQDPSLAEIASMIDPTGVVDVVNAYNKPICEPLPMPR